MKRAVVFSVFLLAALLAVSALGEQAAYDYSENEWGFLEASMDVSRGIPENAEGVLARIRETGKLRVATEPYFAPQEFIDPELSGQDQYVGADMTFARLIAERMGVELEIVPLDFSDVLPAVEDGTCDLAISGLAFTPGRAAQVSLSKGYYFAGEQSGSCLMIRSSDSARITSLDNLKGRNIVAQSGSLQEMQMAESVRQYRQFRRVSSMQEVYQVLEKGQADAAAVNIDAGLVYLESHPDCGLMLVPEVSFPLEEQFEGDRVAAKRGELQLIAFVNGVIDEILPTGLYQAWFEESQVRAAELGY